MTLSAEDGTSGVAQMRFFDSIYGEWEKYATSKLWTFKTGDTYKTVYVQFRDNAGLFSTAYPATIYFGSNPPADPLAREPEKPQEKLPENPPAEPQEKPQENNVPKETTPNLPTTPPSASTADMYFVPATIGIIIAITIVSITRERMLRKRP